MKRTLLFVIIAAQALLMNGCKNEEPAAGIYEEGEQFFARLPEELALPDGSVVLKDDIGMKISIPGNLDLDFAFIRYAEPIYGVLPSGVSLSDFIDPDTSEPWSDTSNISKEEESPQWIKIKAGDVLENGLKVVSALTRCMPGDDGSMIYFTEMVQTEGGITFDGSLCRSRGKDIRFYPGITNKIPVAYGRVPENTSIPICASDVGALKDKIPVNTVCRAVISFEEIVITDTGLKGKITNIELDI